jgi:hypothetical protein
MPIDLTILIPTWDRPEAVNSRLKEIDALWEGTITVVIQVNPGKFNASHINRNLYRGTVVLRENKYNIGMVANIVCGIAAVESEWLWILGDDDELRDDAKTQIDSGIELAEQDRAIGILFNQWPKTFDNNPINSRAIETFLQSTSFSDILFITSFVWRLSFFQENLVTFVDYSFSRASQALILLASQVNGDSTIIIVNHPLVHYEYIVRWSRLDYLQRIKSIFVHPLLRSRDVAVKTTELLWPQCKWALLSAAHEQLKRGEITMHEWYGAAASFSLHLLLSCPPIKALRRIIYIFRIPLQIYSPAYLLTLVTTKLTRRLSIIPGSKGRSS